MRYRERGYNHHSTYEWIGLNGNVINKNIEVKENSKIKIKNPNKFLSKKNRQSKRQLTRHKRIKTAPLCHIDIVEDLTLRKR